MVFEAVSTRRKEEREREREGEEKPAVAGYLPRRRAGKKATKPGRGVAMASTAAATEKVEMLKALFAMPPTHPTRMIANRQLLVLEFYPTHLPR